MTMRLGMLGMHHTHAHGLVRQIAAHPDEFTLVAAFDPEADIANARREEWGPALPSLRIVDTPEEVLGEALDGVVVEGRVWQNVGWARMALEKGYPVLLEKPAGDKLQEFQELVELSRRSGLHLQMLYLFRYMTAVLEMHRLVRSGELGQVYEFRARLPKELENYEPNAANYDWHPGGMFFEMAGHVIDMMVTILGPPQNVTPFVAQHHPALDEFPKREKRFVDNGVGIFEFPHSWGIIEVPALEVAPRARRIEVYGTKGACSILNLGSGHLANDPVQSVEVFRLGADDWQRDDMPAATLQIADLREFAACVSGKKEPDYDLAHDLVVQESLLRASGVL